MKTDIFIGDCCLYDVNYYGIFKNCEHAFDKNDGKRVPLCIRPSNEHERPYFDDVIGFAIISAKDTVGVTAECHSFEPIEIDNLVLDAYIIDVEFESNTSEKPKLVISGNIRAIIVTNIEACPLHDCVRALKKED